MSIEREFDRREIRSAAQAGRFYPADPAELRSEVERCLAAAKVPEGKAPKALIAPHAGYMFSGPVAGTVYACLARAKDAVSRVLLLGPSHEMAFAGLATSTARAFATPLGLVPVDEEALERARALPQVTTLDAAHRHEHSIEVQLPFLQVVLPRFSLVPLVVGEATPAEVSQVLDLLWGGPETCLIISSDLSHYHDYHTARRLDRDAARAIEALAEDELGDEQACGCRPIRGLLRAARQRGLKAGTVDLRNSGDTAGRRDWVVGYGGFVFAEG